jgi:carboxylesterase
MAENSFCVHFSHFLRDKLLFKKGGEPLCFSGTSDDVVLCLHGYNADTTEVRPLVDVLKHEKEYNILAPTIPNHGVKDIAKSLKELRQFNATDTISYYSEIIQDLHKQGKSIFIYGQSLGGAIALILASKFAYIKALALTAPAVKLPTGLGTLANLFGWLNIKFVLKNDNIFSTKGGKQTYILTKMAQKCLKSINCPILICHSKDDTIIPAKSSLFVSNQIPEKIKLHWYEHSRHTMLLGDKSQEIVQDIIIFLKSTKN